MILGANAEKEENMPTDAGNREKNNIKSKKKNSVKLKKLKISVKKNNF